jgi:hypothetical protein
MPGYPSGLVIRIKKKERNKMSDFINPETVKVLKKVSGRNWKEWHHGYLGIILMTLGFILGLTINPWWGRILCPLGFLIMADDWAKDIVGVKTTPLRILNDWMGRHFPIYNKICSILDWLCGKRQ